MQNRQHKPEDPYYGHLQTSLLALIEKRPGRVLEIGCGRGLALQYLKRNRAADFVVGVELVPEVAAIARKNTELDLVLAGDVEQMELDFPAGYFDLIIASHVLEHLKDPWLFTRRLVRLLKSDGQLIGALPNVRFVKVSLPLVFFGKWQYEKEGVLDRTHTKFFTQETIDDTLRTSGLTVRKIQPEFSPKARMINKITFGIFRHLLCFAYNFSAQPNADPRNVDVDAAVRVAASKAYATRGLQRNGSSTIRP
ncbi:MAG TPA: class I SAM-dependent methyltransferase [Terriglobales bacterium]